MKRLTDITESALPTQRKLEVLKGLVTGLNRLNDPDPATGLIANVRARLSFASTVRRRSIDQESAAWNAAVESISNPRLCPFTRAFE